MKKLRKDEAAIASMNSPMYRRNMQPGALPGSMPAPAAPASVPSVVSGSMQSPMQNPAPNSMQSAPVSVNTATQSPVQTPVGSSMAPVTPIKERVDAIAAYIKEQKQTGSFTDGQIVLALRNQGCTDREIQDAFLSLNNVNIR